MKITIGGAGGIGSNVAVNLVRAGITTLTIIDFDKVEPSNLNRQFYFADQIGGLKVEMLAKNLLRINPEIKITPIAKRVTPENIQELFIDCDTIVEGFDGSNDKKMMLEQLGSRDSLLVSASGIAGIELDRICTRKIGNGIIVGDFLTDCCNAPLYSHKVLAVAAKMTEIILTGGLKNG